MADRAERVKGEGWMIGIGGNQVCRLVANQPGPVCLVVARVSARISSIP